MATNNIELSEHEKKLCSLDNKILDDFDNAYNNKNQKHKYLGLHRIFPNSIGENATEPKNLEAYYYIGYRWLDSKEKSYIRISPKTHTNIHKKDIKADYLTMFLTCLSDPIVSQKLDETYKIFFNEKWIKIEQEENDEITPLLILHFLKVVQKISQKGLKKGYVKITENLTSKIKGKILINQTIRKNHLKNRFDRTVCTHQIYTMNCLENQIIKTALKQCSRHLKIDANNDLIKLLKQNLNTFELIDTKEVFNNDFSTIKHSAFYKDYKDALMLAQMIFKQLGFTLDGQCSGKKYKIPPYYIDMPELFERYVEVQLRKEYNDNLLPGYSYKFGNSYEWKLRPDFIIKNGQKIIDAKYKYWILDNKSDSRKDDYQQLSLYGRSKQIRDKIGLGRGNDIAELIFIFPKYNENGDAGKIGDKEADTHFINIFDQAIQIPFLNK